MDQQSCYVQLLALLVPVISLCDSAEYFIRPTTLTTNTSCPSQPCLTVHQYMNNTGYNIQSNTVLIFLPGNHVLTRPVQIQNVENVTLKSTIPDMYPELRVQYSCENELCRSTQSAIKLVNVTNVTVKEISLKVLTPNVYGVIVELSTNVHLQLDIDYVPDNYTNGIAVLANETHFFYMNRIRVGNFYEGITLKKCSNMSFTSIHASSNRVKGMHLFECSNINMANVSATNNQWHGMYLESCNNTNLTTIHTTYNQGSGMILDLCNNSTLTGIYSSNNQESGMNLDKCSSMTMTNVSATNNQWNGMVLGTCANTHLTLIHATYNGGDGMILNSCNKTTLSGIYASSNRKSRGIVLEECSNINMTSVSTTDNQEGMALISCSNTNLTTMNTTSNQGRGMYLESCNNTNLTGVHTTYNQGSGIFWNYVTIQH